MTKYWPENLYPIRDAIYVTIGCIMLFIAEKWIPLSEIDERKSAAWEKGIISTHRFH